VDKELYQMTIHETRRLLDKKEIYSKDLVSSVFERIESIKSRINAYITIAKDTAFKQAEAADEKKAFQSEYR
jgi:Asp-tRNA(Asn)/Glu-tRNA(Gln) amidotransferase A subunit family amidase